MLAAAPRLWTGRMELLWWAIRALRNEVWGFRFHYPIEPVPAAGDRGSSHYHIYSERLFFDVMELDSQGVPFAHYRTLGRRYNPAYVAWYGLMRLERAVRGIDPGGRDAFLTQLTWLVTHAVARGDGAVVWQYDFDWTEGACRLRAPWISAMSQGLAMSALVRGHRVTGDARLLELARAACAVFDRDVSHGGVRTVVGGHSLYEEYPGIPSPHVLDGFLFSLLGLYDLSAETGDPVASRLLAGGIDGLEHTLPFWDYRGKWSWYGSHAYLCPPAYHILNAALLTSLARLSESPVLERYARAWDPRRLSAANRAEVVLVFLLTKNRSRLKHHLGDAIPGTPRASGDH